MLMFFESILAKDLLPGDLFWAYRASREERGWVLLLVNVQTYTVGENIGASVQMCMLTSVYPSGEIRTWDHVSEGWRFQAIRQV